MLKGIVFDIKEFALYDGPGIRTTVFMKGCPLRCAWCHNPEGLSKQPQLMVSPSSCQHCGKCAAVCEHPDHCVACGKCVAHCPLGLRRIAGTEYTPDELADRLKRDAAILTAAGGGVTFSGGEPLMQWPFVRAVLDRLDSIHTAVETSSYVSDEVFAEAMSRFSLIMMDLKAMDPAVHQKYTGVDNAPILHHARMLCEGDTPFIIRMPVIPGVNDQPAHFEKAAALIKGAPSLIRVELLPYHRTAGAKYAMLQKEYHVDFDETAQPRMMTEPFENAGIPVLVMKQS